MKSRTNYNIRIFHNSKEPTVSTLSSNGQYFYRIKEPRDLSWGLFCSRIAFFDINNNLVYYKKDRLAQIFLNTDNSAKIVCWSKSGQLAYFVEHSFGNAHHILLNLKNNTVSKTEFDNTYRDNLAAELFKQLPDDKAQEIYLKIISTPEDEIENILNYILSFKIIEDKRKLIKSFEEYFFNPFKVVLRKIEANNFEDSIISNDLFEFAEYKCDKIFFNFLQFIGLFSWRPRK